MDIFRVVRQSLSIAVLACAASGHALAGTPAGGSPAVNINTADAAALADAIDGVGVSRAQAIVDYRHEHGRFKSVDELTRIKGIGATTVDHNRERLSVH